MGIRSSTFSGIELSGESAEAFLRQINDPTPNLYAEAVIRRGRKLAEEYARNGYVVIKPRKTKAVEHEGSIE